MQRWDIPVRAPGCFASDRDRALGPLGTHLVNKVGNDGPRALGRVTQAIVAHKAADLDFGKRRRVLADGEVRPEVLGGGAQGEAEDRGDDGGEHDAEILRWEWEGSDRRPRCWT